MVDGDSSMVERLVLGCLDSRNRTGVLIIEEEWGIGGNLQLKYKSTVALAPSSNGLVIPSKVPDPPAGEKYQCFAPQAMTSPIIDQCH